MKKILHILCCILYCNISVLAQNTDITGCYDLFEYPYYIEIKDSNFYYIKFVERNKTIEESDTLAKATWEWVDKNFIKIKSKSPHQVALSSMKVTQYKDNTFYDSIKVIFQMPYQSSLLINLCDNNYRWNKFVYLGKKNSIKLPVDTKELIFDIHPESPIEQAYGKFYGVVTFSNLFDEIKIENGMNLINIDIPAIDDSYFERYYIVDEFVRVKNDCIYWHGDIFKKRE